jgi:hypothetical protein
MVKYLLPKDNNFIQIQYNLVTQPQKWIISGMCYKPHTLNAKNLQNWMLVKYYVQNKSQYYHVTVFQKSISSGVCK